MKKGDEFICKKDLIDINGVHIFFIGKFYSIDYIDNSGNEIRVNCFDNEWGHFWFYLKDDKKILNRFNDYFTTLKELRKKKLYEIERG